MIFAWMSDPAAWAGLLTLIALEIVLGIDNLVFIAILADKLPPEQRERARLTGLALALISRLGLLASIAWITTLTEPLFTLLGFEISGRDLILLTGGLFLLYKGTSELHEHLEGPSSQTGGAREHAVFWQVIVQIVVLDIVFSLDSVITAVGMVDDLSLMMTAVIVSVGVMLLASRPLMAFISAHPTVVVLCLGFLMMIGFSLILEGFGFELPKGYLYAAIGFSILIELFHQTARRRRVKRVTDGDLRGRAADAVLALLGGRRGDAALNLAPATLGETQAVIAEQAAVQQLFAPEEKEMIQSVLTLADRPVKSIMTPRTAIAWLDIDAGDQALRGRIFELGHSRFPVARGSLDRFIGVAHARDLLHDLQDDGEIDVERSVRQPLAVHESVSVLRLLEQVRAAPLQIAFVVNEHGSLEGLVRPIDILKTIVGASPGSQAEAVVEQAGDGSWLADGRVDIRRISSVIGVDLVDATNRYVTLAGYILWKIGHLPEAGERVTADDLVFEVRAIEGHNIDKVRIQRLAANV